MTNKKLDPCANCADTYIVSGNDVNSKVVNSVNKKLCMSCGYDNSQQAQNK